MILIVCGALLGVALVAYVIGRNLPSAWRVERSIVVKAPPESIYPHVASFQAWDKWSPWKDPSLSTSYSGPSEGVGNTMRWEGKQKGSMRIAAASQRSGVVFDLECSGMKMRGTLAFARQGEGTLVRWVDEGDVGASVFMRYMAAVMLQRFVGNKLAQGLADLKKLVETTRIPVEV